MNARELIQGLKAKIETESGFQDSNVEVVMIGDSHEAKANVLIPLEGKLQVIEVTARNLGVIQSD